MEKENIIGLLQRIEHQNDKDKGFTDKIGTQM